MLLDQKDKWESEIHISEGKDIIHTKGGHVFIRKYRFMASGGGARIAPFYQTGIFTNLILK